MMIWSTDLILSKFSTKRAAQRTNCKNKFTLKLLILLYATFLTGSIVALWPMVLQEVEKRIGNHNQPCVYDLKRYLDF